MEMISFARGAPAPELLPVEELADCAETVLKRDGKTILSYGSGAGYTPLRELVGEWFDVHPGRVLLTNGGLQALDLLTRNLAWGQTVMCEAPTYDRAYNVFLKGGASVIVADVDEHGVNPDRVEAEIAAQTTPAFIYVIPTFQNPTGTTLPADRRERLVKFADKRGITIVEDDPYSLVRFEGEAPPSLFAYSGKKAIYMSSFSKTVSPGLRVGFTILPEALSDVLTNAANGTWITPVLLSQAVVHEFIRRGSFAPNLERVNEQLKLRRDAMQAALEKHFSGARWVRPDGGYFMWLELPAGKDGREVLKNAEGVAAVPGTDFGSTANYIRLAYSFASPDQMDEGVRRLAAAA